MKIAPFAGSASGLLGFGGWATVGHSYATGPQSKSAVPVNLTFDSNNELGDFKGGICVDKLLNESEKALFNKDGIAKEEWKKLDRKFKDSKGETRGCIAVSWDRTLGNNGLWGGLIKYEWLFSKGNETIVVNGYYDTNVAPNNKDNWRAIYINTETKSKAWYLWLIRKHNMPNSRHGSALKGEVHPDYSKVCFVATCKGLPWKEPYYGARWIWESNGTADHDFSDWSDFKEITECEDSMVDLRDLMGKENGTWKSF